jgi:ATP-dependent exoDNAse (exonuclease V) beta subunit
MSEDVFAEPKAEAKKPVAKKEKKPKLSQKERLEHAAAVHKANMEKAEKAKAALELKEGEKSKKAEEKKAKLADAAGTKAEKAEKLKKERQEAKEAKAKAKAKAKVSTGPRAFGASPNKGKEIVVLTGEGSFHGHLNPRREGTNGHASFALLRPGITYEEYILAGGRSVDLAYDIEHGFVKVVEVEKAAE